MFSTFNMIVTLLLASILFLNVCSGSTSEEEALRLRFEQFKADFNKKYETEQEEIRRFDIFQSKVKAIEQHNARSDISFKKGSNIKYSFFHI